MITLKEIKHRYCMPFKVSFAKDIDRYISEPIVQHYLDKALQHALTEADRDWLWANSQHAGRYPHLNYLCTIYIHPLTIAQNCLRIALTLEA